MGRETERSSQGSGGTKTQVSSFHIESFQKDDLRNAEEDERREKRRSSKQEVDNDDQNHHERSREGRSHHSSSESRKHERHSESRKSQGKISHHK